MITRAGPGIAAQGIIGVKRSAKNLTKQKTRQGVSHKRFSNQVRPHCQSASPHRQQSRLSGADHHQMPVVLNPRENTLAQLLRQKLQAARMSGQGREYLESDTTQEYVTEMGVSSMLEQVPDAYKNHVSNNDAASA